MSYQLDTWGVILYGLLLLGAMGKKAEYVTMPNPTAAKFWNAAVLVSTFWIFCRFCAGVQR